MSDYDRSVAWLEDLSQRPHVPAQVAGLERARFLLAQLGDPQRAFRSVHVAGSGGKGSTTTMIGSILQSAGNRTGYFRSPHLETYRERIAVDDAVIDERAWLECFSRVSAAAEDMERGAFPQYDWGRPTLFEVLFAMAALHFRDCGVAWASVETGLGGRLDATNTLEPDVAVVTNISLEHTRVLGNSIGDIATEKAAIIKTGSDAVTAARDPVALAVIEQRARLQGVRLRRLDRDFSVVTRAEPGDGAGLSVTLWDARGRLDVDLAVAGTFQALNAATAFGAARALQGRDVALDTDSIRSGLARAQIPGRFELIRGSPCVVLDGAHNPAAMRELSAALKSRFPHRRIVLLCAVLEDKDVQTMAGVIGGQVDLVVATRAPGTDRTLSARSLAGTFKGLARTIMTHEDPAEALSVAMAATGPEDVLVVAGSLYLVGWARACLASMRVGT